MARPNKQGVDYFPLDVHLDDKFKFIEIKYKLEGFAVLIKLMQKIYSYGYWYRWTDDEALLFSDELRTDYETVKGVVDEALDRGVFDKDMYDKYSILTSKGIQKRYKEIVRRRKDVEVTEEYLLIDNNFGVNDDINPSSRSQDDSKSTQSKVKESKQNKDSPKPAYDDSSLYYKMADYFLTLLRKNNPDHKQPNMQKWADTFRKIVELDKRNKDEVRNIMEFVQSDDFEMVNVQSPDKIRKRYDQLLMKSKKEHEQSRPTPINKPKKSATQLRHEEMMKQARG